MGRISFSLLIGLFYCWAAPAIADYTLILKNGRQITVQSYRDEGGMIKFHGFGGEIALARDQIQSIRRAGDSEKSSLNLTRPEPATSVPMNEPPVEEKTPTLQVGEKKTAGTEEGLAQQRAKEQKALEAKLKEVTDQLRQLRDRYAAQTTGVVGPEPGFFTSEEAFRGHQEDLLSRLRDAQYRAQGLTTGENVASPPLTVDAPPAYTQKQKELSELRSQMNQLENERQRLVEEMKRVNPDLGDLLRE